MDEAQLVTLAGNVHPLARAEFDRGAAEPETRLERMLLLLKPAAASQAALDALVESQQDPRSKNFHKWLTPAQFGARFGASAVDGSRVEEWLRRHGFTVDEVAAGNRLVIFSGTAEQVAEAFHTEMHRYRVAGVEHLANSQDPQIPEALAGVVGGVVSLHDFRRRSTIAARRGMTAGPEIKTDVHARAQWDLYGAHYLFPADFAAIYDLNPLYGAGTTGADAGIAIAGRSNINLSDVAAFRASAELAANNPTVTPDGSDPGLVEGDQDEATLDVEWAGAVAPAATVTLVAAASTAVTDGVDLSAQYIVNHAVAPVVSVSFASCEREMGATELAFYNSLWEQAASQGMTVLVASGDAGAAGCDQAKAATGTVAGVNGLCSSPYATCVGGTELNDMANPGAYWAQTNSAAQGSALGYIPEQVWNESGSAGGMGLWASGGGVSETYAQPTWQLGVTGAVANGMRTVPDVSLTAAGHDGYIIYENGSDWIVSGTSAAAPSLAGIFSLVVQTMSGSGLGGANGSLYALAGEGDSPFHATPAGTNSVPGVAGFAASGGTYNAATGLGSVDGALLVSAWKAAATAPPTLALAGPSSTVAVAAGGSATVRLTASTGGSFTGGVALSVAGLPAGVTAAWSNNPMQSGAGAAALTLKASLEAKPGAAQVVVTATGSGVTATQVVPVEVNAFPLRIRREPLPTRLPGPRH